jgi:hypothetical protein
MTGPEHFRHAEKAVERAEESLYYTYPNVSVEYVRGCLDVAQVRLALATFQALYALHMETSHADLTDDGAAE